MAGSAVQIGTASSYASLVALGAYTPFNLFAVLVPTSSATTLTGFAINMTYAGVTNVQNGGAGITLTTTNGVTGLYTCSVTTSAVTTYSSGTTPIVAWISSATSPSDLVLSYPTLASNTINYTSGIGIADSSVNQGNIIPITLLNQIDALAYTGLTVGSIYYIQPSGYLGTTVTSYPFGRAISATQMNLTRTP